MRLRDQLGPLAWAPWKIALAGATTLVEVNRAIIGSTARALVSTVADALAEPCVSPLEQRS